MLAGEPSSTLGRSSRGSRGHIDAPQLTNQQIWVQRLQSLGRVDHHDKGKMVLTGFHCGRLILHDAVAKQISEHIKELDNGTSTFTLSAENADELPYHFQLTTNTFWAANEYASCVLYRAIGSLEAANKNVELAVLSVHQLLTTKRIPVHITANMSEWRNLDKWANPEQITFINYTELFLSSIIVNPRGNFKHCYQADKAYNSEGEIYRLRRTNRADAFVESDPGQRFDDYLYYHPQAKSKLSISARTTFLARDPLQLVNDWLHEIENWERTYQQEPFQQCAKDAAQKFREKLKKTNGMVTVPELSRLLIMQPMHSADLPIVLLNRILYAQQYLLLHPDCTHLQLLQEIYSHRNFLLHAQDYHLLTSTTNEALVPLPSPELQAQLSREDFSSNQMIYDPTIVTELQKFESLAVVKNAFWRGNYAPLDIIWKFGIPLQLIRDFSRTDFKKIQMPGRSVTDRWLELLLKVLPTPHNIEELDLRQNQLTDKSVASLKMIISRSFNLKFLNVSGNQFANDLIPGFDRRSQVTPLPERERSVSAEQLALDLHRLSPAKPQSVLGGTPSPSSSEVLTADRSNSSALSSPSVSIAGSPIPERVTLLQRDVSALSLPLPAPLPPELAATPAPVLAPAPVMLPEPQNQRRVLKRESRRSLHSFFGLKHSDSNKSLPVRPGGFTTLGHSSGQDEPKALKPPDGPPTL
jgi:hypothetical protein